MRFESPRLVEAFGAACGSGCWLLFRTLRKDVRTPQGVSPYNASGPARYLFSVWHDSAVIAAFGGRHSRTIALTSAHRDGTFVMGALRPIEVPAIRGSSGRGGGTAARKLLQVARTNDIVITPDGPRGPRREMSRGIIYLASRTGNAIVPTAFACANAWEIPGTWTTQIIPKPFSYVALLAGVPVSVPRHLDADEIELYRARVQRAMDALQDTADGVVEARAAKLPANQPPRTLPERTAWVTDVAERPLVGSKSS